MLIRFATTPQSCPEAAKIGTVEVKTPLLDHLTPGYIYVDKPFANPFNSLLGIYLAVEDEQSGIVAKLAGKVTPNPSTGQLTATFTENPQLPIEDVKTRFFNGPRATLTTPPTCGVHTTDVTLTPWSTPDGATVQKEDSFQTTVSPDGGSCSSNTSEAASKPAFSEVGTADIAAGSGITPLHTQAHAYLAGPYKGAPLSIVVITPAVAGPFDLGVVTTRVALYVDPETAKIHAVSDPLPQIIEGIPLDVRSINLELGRPSFTINPTSCDPSAVLGSETSALGSTQALSSPFQVGGCSALPFKPKLAISLKGGTKRRVSVELPHSAFLEQSHIGTICTKVQFNQGSIPGEKCPARSIYGKATATTPLLDQPLSGPVFLRSSTHQLPDLVVALHGQVDMVIAGTVDSVKGALRNTFEAVPTPRSPSSPCRCKAARRA